MKQSTVEQLADFSEKSGKIIAALIREQPDCISTQAFMEFVAVVQKFAHAIDGNNDTTIKGSEIYEEFTSAKQEAIRYLLREKR